MSATSAYYKLERRLECIRLLYPRISSDFLSPELTPPPVPPLPTPLPFRLCSSTGNLSISLAYLSADDTTPATSIPLQFHILPLASFIDFLQMRSRSCTSGGAPVPGGVGFRRRGVKPRRRSPALGLGWVR